MAVKVNVRNKVPPPRTKANWILMRQEFVGRALRGEPLTLRAFAEEKGISYTHMRVKAGSEKWLQEVEDRMEAQNIHQLEELRRAHEESIHRLRSMAINDETRVRSRHANMGRVLAQKAFARLQELKPEEMTMKDVIQALKLGIELERQALGLAPMPSSVELTNPSQVIEEETRRTVSSSVVDDILGEALENLMSRYSDAPEPSRVN